MATSDEFDGDLSLWTEVDPSSAGTFSVVSGQLQLVHAASNDTDLWTDQKDAPRLIQAVTTPLDIAVKLAAVPAEDGGYGIAVFDTARTNLVRLDYYTNGGTTNLFFAHVNAGANEIGFNGTVVGNPLYLRIVMPDANSAEAYTSADGETWTLRDTLDLTIDGALTAAEAGPYGSGAFSPFPGETYLFDWVRFDLTPGGGGAITPAAVTVTATASSVVITTTAAVTPAATSVTATPGTLTVSVGGAAQDVTPAAVTVTAAAGTVSLDVDVVPGPASVTAAPGTTTLAVDVPLTDPGVTVAPGALTIVQGTAIVPADVTVTAGPGTLTITAGAVDVTPAATTIATAAGTLTVTLSITAADPAVTATAGTLTITGGAAAGPAGPAVAPVAVSVATVAAAVTSTATVSGG